MDTYSRPTALASSFGIWIALVTIWLRKVQYSDPHGVNIHFSVVNAEEKGQDVQLSLCIDYINISDAAVFARATWRAIKG